MECKRKCRFCPKVGTKKEIRGHVYSHFASKILDDNPCLRKKPFICPKCTSKTWRDRTALLRHFALKHNVIYKYCSSEEVYGLPITKNKKVNKINLNEYDAGAKKKLLENAYNPRYVLKHKPNTECLPIILFTLDYKP